MAYKPVVSGEGFSKFIKDMYRGALASAPSGPKNGWMYFNTGDNVLYIYVSGWIALLAATLSYILLETGSYLLLETGDKLVKE